MRQLFLLITVLLIFNISCQKPIEKEGYIKVEGGQLWYKIVGEGNGIPLLIIHGGPGGRSCNMIPGFAPLGNDRPLIFYDQLDSGNSDRPGDSTFWTIERFVDEIDYIRNALDLKELHILGHSSGSVFLIEYLLTRNPKGVKSVILSGPVISTPIWMDDAKILLTKLPVNVQDTIKKYEILKDYLNTEYIAARDVYYSQFLTRKSWPYNHPIDCKDVPHFNIHVYRHIWGATEFNANGLLEHYDRTTDLHKITQPILFMTGEFDEARPETVYKFQKMVDNSTVSVIEGSGHMTMIDQPERVNIALNKFFESVE